MTNSEQKSWFGAKSSLLLAAAAILLGFAVIAVSIRLGGARSIPIGAVSHLHGIAVDAIDSSQLLLATHSGLYRASSDGIARRVSSDANDYMGFTPHPADTSLFYASGHPATGGNLGVISSTDGGQRWTELSSGAFGPVDFHAITVSQADPTVLYGAFGGIQISRDGGRTWSIAGLAPAEIVDLAASSENSDIIYAATKRGLMISRDAGKIWEMALQQTQPATMVETMPDGTIYAFVIGSGLIKLPLSEPSWRPVNEAFGDQLILHLAADPTDPLRLFAVTDAGRILSSNDGGKTWPPFS